MRYKSRDFKCLSCNHIFNDIVPDGVDPDPCPACGCLSFEKLLTAPAVMSNIVVDYPGSKRLKAGYVHTHGDRPAEKAGSQVSMFNPKK